MTDENIWDEKPKSEPSHHADSGPDTRYNAYEMDDWLEKVRAEEERKDQEYMELIQKQWNLKRCYDNLLKQYEVAKEKAETLEAVKIERPKRKRFICGLCSFKSDDRDEMEEHLNADHRRLKT